MSRVSIVVPVFCNASSLGDLFARLDAVARRAPEDEFEFVFVEDGSSDDSFARLIELVERDARVRIVKLSRNFGSNQALLAGLAHATGDVVGTLSADLQDPPELLLDMLHHWRAGRKVVLAARRGRRDPPLTTLLADTFYALFRRYAIATMPPRGFDFFMIDRQVCDIVRGIEENNPYLMGLILWLGFDPVSVTFDREPRLRAYGRSGWTAARKLKYFVDSFAAFSHVPLRLASLMGIFVALLGAAYAGLVVLLRWTKGFPVEGWASLMVAVLLLSGMQLFVTGVLGEYLWRTLDETRRRPRWVVDRVVRPVSDGSRTGSDRA